jgi:hypothetical protein
MSNHPSKKPRRPSTPLGLPPDASPPASSSKEAVRAKVDRIREKTARAAQLKENEKKERVAREEEAEAEEEVVVSCYVGMPSVPDDDDSDDDDSEEEEEDVSDHEGEAPDDNRYVATTSDISDIYSTVDMRPAPSPYAPYESHDRGDRGYGGCWISQTLWLMQPRCAV